MDIKSSTIREARYLARLEFLKRPPEMIYYYGKIPEYVGESAPSARFPKEGVGRPKTVAVVGARKMTAYGETWAYKIAKELAEMGVIIVSGLATGIDTAAHRGALAGQGRTIALLGTPIDRIYPAENQGLFEQILTQDGCVMSELAVGAKYYPKTAFLERNRLIAGLADAVVVVEADLRSGSLNTASHALEQGVPLFAVPGDLSRQMSRGCNSLFNKGATAVTAVEDILGVLFTGSIHQQRKQKIKLFGSTPDETAVLECLTAGLTAGEEILSQIKTKEADFDVTRFNVAITMLEIRGVVKRDFNNRWLLC